MNITPAADTPDAVYSALRARCLPFIEGYQSDLEHDRNAITKNPGIPFIHITRDCGTHIVLLYPFDSPLWPAEGQQVPYLFGTADRYHILRSAADFLTATAKTSRVRIVHHYQPASRWRGHSLGEINMHEAGEIVRSYTGMVLDCWTALKQANEQTTSPANILRIAA